MKISTSNFYHQNQQFYQINKLSNENLSLLQKQAFLEKRNQELTPEQKEPCI